MAGKRRARGSGNGCAPRQWNCAALVLFHPFSRCSNPRLSHIAALIASCDHPSNSPTALGRTQFLKLRRRCGNPATGGFRSRVTGAIKCPRPMPWPQRKLAVLVAANKYWRERKWARAHSTKDALRITAARTRKRLSPTYQSCWRLQLHDARIDLLQVLGLRARSRSLGAAGTTPEICRHIRPPRLAAIRSVFRGPCDDKHELLSRYKFVIAYENTAYPGYVTEKVIDAIVAGSVPVYMGAPDIADQLPAGSIYRCASLWLPGSDRCSHGTNDRVRGSGYDSRGTGVLAVLRKASGIHMKASASGSYRLRAEG